MRDVLFSVNIKPVMERSSMQSREHGDRGSPDAGSSPAVPQPWCLTTLNQVGLQSPEILNL